VRERERVTEKEKKNERERERETERVRKKERGSERAATVAADEERKGRAGNLGERNRYYVKRPPCRLVVAGNEGKKEGRKPCCCCCLQDWLLSPYVRPLSSLAHRQTHCTRSLPSAAAEVSSSCESGKSCRQSNK
jgi:hypothetical protein